MIKRTEDYLHFKIEYFYNSNSCAALGMAWLLEGKPFYYLSEVYLNNAYAYPKKLNLAGLKEVNSRIVFYDPEMVDTLYTEILKHYGNTTKG